jgi:Spherulation-specific family 4
MNHKRHLSLSAALRRMGMVSVALVSLGLTAQMAAAQSMAVPAYFYPGPFWSQLDRAGSGVDVAVMNPNSGPGTGPDPQYVRAVRSAKAAGITVVGYVYTSYGVGRWQRWNPTSTTTTAGILASG